MVWLSLDFDASHVLFWFKWLMCLRKEASWISGVSQFVKWMSWFCLGGNISYYESKWYYVVVDIAFVHPGSFLFQMHSKPPFMSHEWFTRQCFNFQLHVSQQEMGQESADIQAGFEKLNTARRESHRIAGSGAGWFRSFLKFSATTAYRVGYRDHAIREWLPRHGNTGKWYTRNAQVTVTTGKPQWFERKEILSQFVTKVYNFQGTVRKRCKAVEGVEVWKGGRIFFEIGLRVLWDFCYLGRVCSVKFKQIFSLQTCWRQKSDTE